MANDITVPTEETVKTEAVADQAIVAENDSKKNASSKTFSKKVPFAVVEAYKTIRTNLTFSLPQSGCKSFVVSSAVPGEGKSTTALNVAIAFSQLGKNVLLIDADLRRPSLHKKTKLLNTKGLYTVLVGISSFEESVQNVNHNFDVLTTGPLPPNPLELLESEAFTNFLKSLQEKYDYVIFDSTPINVVSDALAMAPKTDGLLLVVRDGCTNREDLRHAIEACNFANIRILGAVLNGVDSKSSKKYSYRRKYYYRYHYRYRYNYNYTANGAETAKK